MNGAFSQDFVEGFLLHRREYRETSYLADFFTLEQGKISAVVKGVRGKKTTKNALLQPFQPLQLLFFGNNELKSLNKIEPADKAMALLGKGMFCGMYLNELLNRALAPELPQVEIYQAYLQSLAALKSATDADFEPLLRDFEFCLLNELGYGVDWYSDSQTQAPIQAELMYCYIHEQGFQQQHFSQGGQNSFSGETIEKVSRKIWDNASLRCAKVVSRIAITGLIGNKPLKSRELFLSQPTTLVTGKS